jgi:CheY-like chemotaxis protein
MQLQFDWFQIDELLNTVGGMFEELAANKGLDFSLMKTSTLPPWMYLDSLRLEQVLVNLISNAIKFTETGGIKIESGFVPHDSERGILRIRVLDSGIGVPEELQTKLFQPFSQADSSISRRFGGTGLGLVISRSIIENFGGSIAFSSLEGSGSDFNVSIPVACRNQQPEASPWTVNSDEEKLSKNSPNFLLVDDVSLNLLVAKKVLLHLLPHCNVIISSGVQEALGKFKDTTIDLVFMDIQMPEIDGIQGAKMVSAISDAPIVALTAGVLGKEREACQNAGMVDFIPKPITIVNVRAVLSKLGFL